KDAGAHGIVTGALTASGEISRAQTAALIAAARPLPVTFHRAFDLCDDLSAALESLILMGVERVLTSGGAPTAPEGAGRIDRLFEHYNGERDAPSARRAHDPRFGADERLLRGPGGGQRARLGLGTQRPDHRHHRRHRP